MGCLCSKGGDDWPPFTPTELSSNKCDGEWEEVTGNPATFAMGSHWGPAARFGAVPGVIRVRVGFTGGVEPDPSYNDPKDHAEALTLHFDPDRVSYQRLLEVFWDYHDWTVENATNYASIIFAHDDQQKAAGNASLTEMTGKTERSIQTKILPYTQFWPSDDEFQHSLLQQQKAIFERLKIPPTMLAHSHLATKVEGYVCGYAKPEMFDDEVTELSLPKSLAVAIRKMCVANQPPEATAGKFSVSVPT